MVTAVYVMPLTECSSTKLAVCLFIAVLGPAGISMMENFSGKM